MLKNAELSQMLPQVRNIPKFIEILSTPTAPNLVPTPSLILPFFNIKHVFKCKSFVTVHRDQNVITELSSDQISNVLDFKHIH